MFRRSLLVPLFFCAFVILAAFGPATAARMNQTVPPPVYLPIINKAEPPSLITGKVTLGGAPVAGVTLSLIRYNNAGATSLLAATTEADGAYTFNTVPTLPAGMAYYVRYRNTENTAGRLASWLGPDITSFTQGNVRSLGVFDIADVALVAPANNLVTAMPVTFKWTKRLAMPTDKYRSAVFGTGFSMSTSALDYNTESATLGCIQPPNPGFVANVGYVWGIVVESPDGGVGYSNGRSITFTGITLCSANRAEKPTYRVSDIRK